MKWQTLKSMTNEELKHLFDAYDASTIEELADKMGVLRYDLTKRKFNEIFDVDIKEEAEKLAKDGLSALEELNIREKALMLSQMITREPENILPLIASLFEEKSEALKFFLSYLDRATPADTVVKLCEEHRKIFDALVIWAIVELKKEAEAEYFKQFKNRIEKGE